MNPLHDVAIVGVANTAQARTLPGETSHTLAATAALAALADAGLTVDDVDGVAQPTVALVYDFRLGPVWEGGAAMGIQAVVEAAMAIVTGQCDVVLIAVGQAGLHADRTAAAPWTLPGEEFVAPFGLFTAAEFALVARRHMETYGTTPEQLALVSATIRNNGHVNPEAVYCGRGPFSAADVLASPMVADPLHLLDCATTTEGGCAVVLTSTARARDLRHRPVVLLGAGRDTFGVPYRYPPSFDLTGRGGDDIPNGFVGRRAADKAFAMAGVDRDDVDVLELYDPFSFEVIRQLEAFRFCKAGEGGPFVEDGGIAVDGPCPVTTDGGTLSFSHAGVGPQVLQRVTRAVQQLRGECATQQVAGAEVALCSSGGAGALFTNVLLVGSQRP